MAELRKTSTRALTAVGATSTEPPATFEEARRFARTLGLTSARQWERYMKSAASGKLDGSLQTPPSSIPRHPNHFFRAEWRGWGHFLTGRVDSSSGGGAGLSRASSGSRGSRAEPGQKPRRGRPPIARPDYETVRDHARSLGLLSAREFMAYLKGQIKTRADGSEIAARPASWSTLSDPEKAYAGKGWTSWGDFLGTDRVAYGRRHHVGFDTARLVARGIGLRSLNQWRRWLAGEIRENDVGERLPTPPSGLPLDPQRIYADRWMGADDFFGPSSVSTTDPRTDALGAA